MICTKIASAADRSHTTQTAANTRTNKSAGDRSPTHQIAADTAHTHANTTSADDRSLTPTIATCHTNVWMEQTYTTKTMTDEAIQQLTSTPVARN